MKALQEEIEELEKAEEETTDEAADESAEVVEDEGTEVVDNEETAEEISEEDAEKFKKQEAYRERQKAKKAEPKPEVPQAPQEAAEVAIPDEMEQIKEELAIARQERALRTQDNMIKQAGKELAALEEPFREAFTDYDDVVNGALELTKMRMVAGGSSDREADDYLAREKVLIADRAAAGGKDPVEAVYNEAKEILSVFDSYAEKKGYTLNGKPKTNLAAMREIAKPNAMTGGAGKGATAAKSDYNDMDSDELDDLSFGEMLKMKDNGEL